MRAERIGNARQRLAEMRRDHLLVGDIVGHLAQAVHVVGKSEQPRLDPPLGQHLEGVAHHAGARDLAKGADMRQAGGTVAGLEQHMGLAAGLDAPDQLARLLERPGLGNAGGFNEFGREGGELGLARTWGRSNRGREAGTVSKGAADASTPRRPRFRHCRIPFARETR